jgi:hypothetical protein
MINDVFNCRRDATIFNILPMDQLDVTPLWFAMVVFCRNLRTPMTASNCLSACPLATSQILKGTINRPSEENFVSPPEYNTHFEPSFAVGISVNLPTESVPMLILERCHVEKRPVGAPGSTWSQLRQCTQKNSKGSDPLFAAR